jgi:crotonobetainyl-CoA:carnitine CoA-transferase CaiB-like acyl-CoA transferase
MTAPDPAAPDHSGREHGPAAARPLHGLRVLDLSRVLAGPWATQLLADLGADVLKIERPGEGDDTRGWGPPWVESADGVAREAAYFLCANRGKRSLAIDVAQPDGARLVAALAAQSDVLVENFKVGGLAKYGLDHETLARANPRLIYCSITGFGLDGPYAARPGYDFIIQGMGGLMGVTGVPDGEPMKAGVAIVDLFSGLYAANAIQAALRHRDATGRGQRIDVSLLDVQVAVMANQALNYLVGGRNPRRLGNAHPNIVPYQAFSTRDGALTVAVGNDAQFARFCAALGVDALATDERYATNAARVANRGTLIPELQARLSGDDTRAWLARLETAGVPAGPINTLAQVFEDPQVVHRGLRVESPHDTLGSVPGVRCPVRMSDAAIGADRGPPPLGAHTREVLRERLGVDDAALDALAARGVI